MLDLQQTEGFRRPDGKGQRCRVWSDGGDFREPVQVHIYTEEGKAPWWSATGAGRCYESLERIYAHIAKLTALREFVAAKLAEVAVPDE